MAAARLGKHGVIRRRVSTGARRMVAGALAAALGFGGAAVVDALLLGHPAVADDFGPGDGLTRYVVQLDGARVTDEQLQSLAAVSGVAHAQRLFDGSALVATDDLSVADLAPVLPGGRVTLSEPGEVFADAVTDPAWEAYGWNLSNTGSNAYSQTAVAGADIAAPLGWRAGTGAGMVVAVVDSGLMTSHPDLQDALWTNPDESCGSTDQDQNGYAGDCHGWNFYNNSADVTNAGGDNSHGTGVSGVVGARSGNGQGSAGVAPNVTLMPLVIGSGKTVDLYAGAQAIRYAADNGADVVNASWGGPGGAAILASAIEYANSKGTVVVAAAGNDALDRDVSLFYPASLNAPNLIKVGNSTAADTMAASSAYGATSVDLFAPGNLVYTTYNDGTYRLISGTSIAAPHVAAAIALYKGVMPNASAADLKAALLADVQPLPAFAGKSVTGGRLSLVDLGNSAADVQYSFASMGGEPGVVTPTVAISGPAPAGNYSARLLLGMQYGSELLAVSGQPITLDGVTATTDDSGEVVFPLGQRSGLGSLVLDPSMEMEEGRYVLVAQIQRDGAALTTPYAAPLLVGVAAAPAPVPGTPVDPAQPVPGPGTSPVPGADTPQPTPGDPAPGTGTPPGGSQPGGSVPGGGDQPDAEQPGGDEPGPGNQPGDDAPSTPVPVTPVPVTPVPVTPVPGAPVVPSPGQPGDPIGATPDPSDEGGEQQPDDDIPGGSGPGADPDLGGEKDYPEVGPFRLTSISPTRVSTAGGTRVTITGAALPDGARVRIGDTTSVETTAVSSTQLVFTTPALVAGTYDVHVFGTDGSSSVLTAGLTYVAVDAGGDGPIDTPDPGDGSGPGLPPDPEEGQEPDDTPEKVVVGPNGRRLVSSALFGSVPRSVWNLDCSVACSGLPL